MSVTYSDVATVISHFAESMINPDFSDGVKPTDACMQIVSYYGLWSFQHSHSAIIFVLLTSTVPMLLGFTFQIHLSLSDIKCEDVSITLLHDHLIAARKDAAASGAMYCLC